MIGKWLAKWRICLCAALMGFSGGAHSAFHLWQITEVYSNASGTVQFIELTALAGGQQFLATGAGQHGITSSSGAQTNTFLFPTNLPGDTAGKKFLIGTTGFAALGIVTPDYIVPNSFLFTANGTILFAEFADTFSYATLPTDGVSSSSISVNTRVVTTTTNSPTNFAGATGTNPPPITVPDAPVIGIAIPGNLEAFISFTPPAGNGGSAIISYTATCNPGMLSATGAASPITVGGLMNNQLYSCSVTAANAIGTGATSSTVGVTPDANPSLALVAVYSRKTHTGFSPFNLWIETGVAIGGAVSVEPRSSTSHTIVFEFNKPVTSVGGAAVSPVGSTSPSPPSGKEFAVILTGVPDKQRATVLLIDVNGPGVNFEAAMGFLVGDVSSSRSVNAGDISSVKARQNQTLDLTNFRFDLTTSGVIDQADVSVVKSRSGVVLP